MLLRDLEKGDCFTLKEIIVPRMNQVYIRGEYDQSLKKYRAHKFSNVNDDRVFDGDREVYTDFVF